MTVVIDVYVQNGKTVRPGNNPYNKKYLRWVDRVRTVGGLRDVLNTQEFENNTPILMIGREVVTKAEAERRLQQG